QYYFFIDCEGHVDDARVGEALMGLRRVCREVRFLGSYARCDGGATHVRPGTSDSEFADAPAWLGRLRLGRPYGPRRPYPGSQDRPAGHAPGPFGIMVVTGTDRSPAAAAVPPCRAAAASSPAAARGASARAGPGPPSAGRTASSGCRGTGLPASPPAGPGRSAVRRRSAVRPR